MSESTHFEIHPRPSSPAPIPVPVRRASRAGVKTRRAAPVFAVTSGKGGVGKTNVVANLAIALSHLNKRVLAIDADLGLANLDLFLGVKPTLTLADFFAGKAALDEIILTSQEGILVMPGASGVQEITSLSAEQKAALLTDLDLLTHEMDLVLVDTGSGISDAVTYFASAAQEIILVVTPDPASMTAACALVKVLLSQYREQRFLVLANNVSDAEDARRLFNDLSLTALRFFNVSLDFLDWIPRDPKLLSAAARAQTVVSNDASAPSARAFAALAEKLLQRTAARIKVKGNLQFFFRRMLEAGKAQR